MFIRHAKCAILLILILVGVTLSAIPTAESAVSGRFNQSFTPKETKTKILSPYWPDGIQRWSMQIGKVAEINGIDPDFVAAVIDAESDGNPTGVSRLGAVGLMGVMPSGPGMEWRPEPEELTDPGVNLRWGVAILTDIIRQSGGDISAALAAYAGGWREATKSIPQQYAADILDEYSRAVLIRSGIEPDIASRWTLAVDMNYGYVTSDTLLVLGDQPVSGLRTYAPHLLYDYLAEDGTHYRVKAHIVPVAIVTPSPDPIMFGSSDGIEPDLTVRMGLVDAKDVVSKGKSPRVILACLPSLNRLRGTQSTRWFAPSSCPDWHR
ncbi:MAG: lytic transglycosylase domain-containing protein [Ardenticatenaceae bacterium]|nr:lytic transglycosylase domain-containing protein [Ardenticatenaceae bacterium]